MEIIFTIKSRVSQLKIMYTVLVFIHKVLCTNTDKRKRRKKKKKRRKEEEGLLGRDALSLTCTRLLRVIRCSG